MRESIVAVACVVFFTAAAVAQTRAPWQLTDEERIEARGRAIAAKHASPHAKGAADAVDGKTAPEQFLPYELFDVLLEGLSPNPKHRDAARHFLDPQLRAFRYPVEAFWTELAGLSRAYLDGREQHRQQHRQMTVLRLPSGDAAFVPIDRDDCSARIAALQEARKQFGGSEFDRFLYTAVAPNASHATASSSADYPATLRFMAAGCK